VNLGLFLLLNYYFRDPEIDEAKSGSAAPAGPAQMEGTNEADGRTSRTK